MRCEELRGLLDLHLDGELPEDLNRKVERHLLRCQPCAHEAHALSQTRGMLREAIAPAEASPAFRERASARLLDRLAPHLRLPSEEGVGRQWTLPFSREE